MTQAPSLLSIAAAGFYGLVVLGCLWALVTARQARQQDWHFRSWLGVALFFAALIASRLLSLEDVIRADLRDFLRAEGAIADRRVWQGYLIAGAIASAAALGLFGLYSLSRRITGRRNIAVLVALGSCGAMLVLVALRIISLHSVDQLLFGALKLNWFGDLGLSLAVMGAAIVYVRVVKAPPMRRSR